MKKKKCHAFGKDIFFLGRDKKGIYYWLEDASWDCDWYWGLGYVETYTNNENPQDAKDINSHQHFDSLFFKGNKNGYDAYKEFFTEITLNDKELWKLIELMRSLYTLKEMSEVCYIGGSHYTENPCKDILKDEDIYNKINKIMIPEVMNKVRELLTP